MTDEPRTRKRRRKPGDIGTLRAVLWAGLVAAEDVVTDPNADRADVLKAAHALASLGGAYTRVVEAHELVPMLEAIEATMTTKGAA